MVIWPTEQATELLADLLGQLDLTLAQAPALRRELHQYPDVCGREGPTAERMRRALGRMRTTKVADTGFLVRVGPEDGPAVAIRAELDALPVAEQTGVPWASTNGAMHACGHDVHLAAAWALLRAARRLPDLPLGLVGLFQPREECQPSGARDVVIAEVLQHQDVRAVIGAHVQPRVPHGVVSTGSGGVNAAADEFDIVVHGFAGHGAYPHVTVDPIPILANIALGLHELVSRLIDPTHPSLITVGRIQAGTSHNIIPATGSLHGIIRTMNEEDRQLLHSAVRRLAQYTASARGGAAEVTIVTGDPVLANDRRLVRAVNPLVEQAGLPLAGEAFRSVGADDFSHYASLAPILMMFVGTGRGPSPDGQHEVGLHHPEFLPGDESIRQVALALAAGYVGGAHVAGTL